MDKPMVAKKIAKQLIQMLKKAIKQFGTYAYEDKGAGEILDIRECVKLLKPLNASQVRDVLIIIREADEDHERFLSDLVCSLDHREDFEEILDDQRLNYLY